MPTYEYECRQCETVFDIFQSITSRPLRKAECEKCGSVQPVRRLIGTGGAVIFKGSGFYETDYRSKGYRDAAKKEKDAATKSSTDGGDKAASGGKTVSGDKSASKDSKSEKSTSKKKSTTAKVGSSSSSTT